MAPVHSMIESPLGVLTAVADGDDLVGIYFTGHRHAPGADALGEHVTEGFEETERQLGEYFTGDRTRFELPLRPRGNEFQLRVWDALREIPYGETRTYGDLARELGCPGAAQAVGSANGRNPLSVIVPCHRVVGAGGALTGYAGGLERKRSLLDLERASAPRLF